MRCLYCGKHLPLLRKLTGGGEFCSDAHRDKYHEEYNRLAVSRLLQAQSRPEEVKRPKRAENGAESETPAPTAPLTEENPPTEIEEVHGSYIDEFRLPEIRPTPLTAEAPSFTITPLFLWEPEVVLPAVEAFSGAPAAEAAFLSVMPSARRTAFSLVASETTGECKIRLVLPALSALNEEHLLGETGAVPYEPRQKPKAPTLEPLALTVSVVSPTAPAPAIPSSPVSHHSGNLSATGALRLRVSARMIDDGDAPEFGTLQDFSCLLEWRPRFEPPLQLMQVDGALGQDIDVAIPGITLPDSDLESERQQNNPDKGDDNGPEPPMATILKRVAVAPVAPGTAILTVGFDSVAIAAKLPSFEHGAQPFRPKMALEPVGAPGSGKGSAYRKGPSDAPKNMPRSILAIDNGGPSEAVKVAPRSMLHLADAAPTDEDAAPDAGTLLGKIGGLFGRKNKGGG